MSVIIRLENLPWEARSIDIRRFFQGLQIPDGGVHIVGGERGDAFIAFHSDDDARQAMQKDGGLLCQQPVKLFLSSKIEMQNVIAAARGKPPASTNPISNSNTQTQQANLSQPKRTDSLSQQFTHDIDENQHQSQQQQQTQSSSTGQTNVPNDPMASFLDVVNKMQQQQKSHSASVSLSAANASAPSGLPTGQTATSGTSGLAPANLVLQLLQSNLGNLPPNLLAQVQGQLAGQGLVTQPSQILQQLTALQAATQQQSSPMQTNSNHSPIYNPSQTNSSLSHHALGQSSMHDANSTSNTNAFSQVAPPPLNPFLTGSLPPNALTALLNVQQQQQQQLPFPSANNPLPANFPLPPWMQPAATQNQTFALQQQQQQQQRPLLNHHHLPDDQQMRSRQSQQQHDFNHNMPNQFQQPYSSGNTRLPQQRTKLREPYLRVKNLSRKYSYRDVKLLFADYKLRLEDIKMINDQNGERTGESVVQFRSIEDAEEALSQFNNVYYGGANVQIVPATEYEFASALDSFVPASVKKRQPEGGYCVKVTGLPKNWYKRDIRRLFTASEIVSERGIYLDNENDNNQGGTAYIEFVSEVDLEKALFYHDEHYGSSRLEIQPITKKEMESDIGALRSKDNRRRDYYEGDSRSRVRSRSRSRSRSPKERDTRRYPQRDDMNGDNSGGSHARRPRYNEELPPTITCLRLRNIPYATRDNDVKSFFAGITIAPDGILFKYDKTGRPAGECYVHFETSNDCRKAYEKNRSQFGGRILELRPLSLWEFQAATSQEPDETGATFSANGGQGRREPFGGGGGGGGGNGPMHHGGFMPEKRKFPYERMDDNGNNSEKSPSDQQRFERQKRESSSPRGGDGDKSPSNMMGGGGSMEEQNGRKMMRGNNNSSLMQKQLTQLPPGYDQYRGQVLLMSNVHFRATREEILQFLRTYHPIEDTLKIHRDSSGRPTGHAVVALTNTEDVPQAMKELNNAFFLLRKITVCVV